MSKVQLLNYKTFVGLEYELTWWHIPTGSASFKLHKLDTAIWSFSSGALQDLMIHHCCIPTSTNLFIYQAKESSLWSLCCGGRNRLMLLYIDCLEKSVDQSIFQSFLVLSHSSRHASKEAPTLVPQSQQRLHNYKLQFLQELGFQKPCWDQARLSSLVNQQLAPHSGKNDDWPMMSRPTDVSNDSFFCY